ncbi:MAG TPA: hypothetical protein VGR20_24380 [Acidimicrobiia bacterium]|nr:hypothetical protein [Acidimicrobiia bacterium]
MLREQPDGDLVAAVGDVGHVAPLLQARVVDDGDPRPAEPEQQAGDLLVVVRGAGAADDADPVLRGQPGRQPAGHEQPLVEVRVDDGAVDLEVGADQRDDPDTRGTGPGGRVGRLGGVEGIHHDRVHPRLDAGVERGRGLGPDVREPEVRRQYPGLAAGPPDCGVQAVRQRVDGRVPALGQGVHVEDAHPGSFLRSGLGA